MANGQLSRGMKVVEVAALLQLHVNTIRRAIASGDLAAVRLGRRGRTIRILPEDVAAFIVRRRVGRPAVGSTRRGVMVWGPVAEGTGGGGECRT
jgi:excisionase family DNA binding protein